jgi:capsular exopolysaccharide synthesis family protein
VTVPQAPDADVLDTADREADMVDEWDEAAEPENIGTYLQSSRPGGALRRAADAAPAEWLFPGADELFRSIYTRAGMGFGSEIIAVCSAIAGEGKTTVAVGLAVTVAQDFPERRVLLVETDTQRSVLAEDFGVDASPGLVDCISTGQPLQVACRPTFLENMHIVPAGGVDGVAGRPLRSNRIAMLIDSMRQNYDLVILDLPPLLVNSDAVLLTDLADGAICIVRSGVTPVKLVTKAIEQLDEGKLRGVVLNGTQTSVPGWLQRLMGM